MEIQIILVALYFLIFIFFLISGYPVGFVLGGVAVLFALAGEFLGLFNIDIGLDLSFLGLAANRFFRMMSNINLVPVPMFIFMGMMLDRSGIAENLLKAFQILLRKVPGGLAMAVTLIGVLLAASTGIIGASVVLLGTIALPTMLKAHYRPELALGTICAAGTLGILIPPSVMLLIMADQMLLSVPDLFMGAMIPGLILSALYLVYIITISLIRPNVAPAGTQSNDVSIGKTELIILIVKSLLPPVLLIVAVLGSIFFGIASPAEAGGVGAFGAIVLTVISKRLNISVVKKVCHATARTTSFVFVLLFGATCFALALRGIGGDEVIENLFYSISSNPQVIVLFIMGLVFFLGFFLDWIEICLIVLPLVLPVLDTFNINPLWFTILVAVCLQTSFLTPPMGPAIFFLQGVTPKEISVMYIYRGIIPFVILQVIGLGLIFFWPELVTWLPSIMSR